MLDEFLKKLGAATGTTYTKAELKKIIEEALAYDEKQEEKKPEEKKKSIFKK